nr:MAG TPA: stabilization protein [Caudoviricetes sp.]
MKNFWKNSKKICREEILDFSGGINTEDSIFHLKANQTPYSINTDSRLKPALCVRPSRKIISSFYKSSFGEVKYFSVFPSGDFFTVCKNPVSGNYDFYNISRNTMYASEESFWFPDSVYYFDRDENRQITLVSIGRGLYFYTGSYDVFAKIENAPAVSVLAGLGGRIYGASDFINKLYISAKDDYSNWRGDDSFEINIPGTSEKCTGLYAFRDCMLYFRKNSIFEIKEYKNQVFEASELCSGIGCISKNSISEINGNLYFLGKNGVYIYKFGSAPKLISGKIDSFIKKYELHSLKLLPASGSDGRRYYLSLVSKDESSSIILVYDTVGESWYFEDNPGIVNFADKGGSMYGISFDGKLYSICGGSDNDESADWSWVSPPLPKGSTSAAAKQKFFSAYVNTELSENSSVLCSVITDCGLSLSVPLNCERENRNIIRLSVPLAHIPVSRYICIKLHGHGSCKIHSLEYSFRSVGK